MEDVLNSLIIIIISVCSTFLKLDKNIVDIRLNIIVIRKSAEKTLKFGPIKD